MKNIFFFTLAVATSLPALAPLVIAQTREKLPQEFKAIAIGARRTAKFTRSTKEYKIKMEGPDGQEIDEVIPAGVPIEIAGKENEYVPYQLYAKNRGARDNVSRFSLGLNTFSPVVKLTPRESVSLFKRRIIPSEGGGDPKFKLESYASVPSYPEASHLLVTIVKNYKELEGWAKPLVKVFDVSPQRLAANSCFVYNSSPFDMVIKFGGRESITLKPFAHNYVSQLRKDKYGAIPYDILLKVGNKIENLPSGGLVGSDRTRHFIFTFVDPRKGVARRGDLAVFSEKVPEIITPSTSPSRPATPSTNGSGL